MKKALAMVLTAALVIGVCMTSAFAAGHGRYYVDADGDGYCDHSSTGCAYVDADGDGVCDRCGLHQSASGCAGNFTDQNGDGICDNYTGACLRSGTGYGYSVHSGGHGHGAGHGHGC